MDISKRFHGKVKIGDLNWDQVRDVHPMLKEVHPFSPYAYPGMYGQDSSEADWPLAWNLDVNLRQFPTPPPTFDFRWPSTTHQQFNDNLIPQEDKYLAFTLDNFVTLLSMHLADSQNVQKNVAALNMLERVAKPLVNKLRAIPNIDAYVFIDKYDAESFKGLRNFNDARVNSLKSVLTRVCKDIQRNVVWKKKHTANPNSMGPDDFATFDPNADDYHLPHRELACQWTSRDKEGNSFHTNIGALDIRFLSLICEMANKNKKPNYNHREHRDWGSVNQISASTRTKVNNLEKKNTIGLLGSHLNKFMYVYVFHKDPLGNQTGPAGCALFNIQNPTVNLLISRPHDELILNTRTTPGKQKSNCFQASDVEPAIERKFVYNMELACVSNSASGKLSFMKDVFLPFSTLFTAYAWRLGDHKERDDRHTIPCISLQAGSFVASDFWHSQGFFPSSLAHLFLCGNPTNGSESARDLVIPISDFPESQKAIYRPIVQNMVATINREDLKSARLAMVNTVSAGEFEHFTYMLGNGARDANNHHIPATQTRVVDTKFKNTNKGVEFPKKFDVDTMWKIGTHGPAHNDDTRRVCSLKSLVDRMTSNEVQIGDDDFDFSSVVSYEGDEPMQLEPDVGDDGDVSMHSEGPESHPWRSLDFLKYTHKIYKYVQPDEEGVPRCIGIREGTDELRCWNEAVFEGGLCERCDRKMQMLWDDQ